MARNFREPNHVNVLFEEDVKGTTKTKLIGELRVKPNAILWRNSNKEKWHFVTLDDFITFMKKRETRKM